METRQILFEIPIELKEKLLLKANRENITMKSIIVRALEKELDEVGYLLKEVEDKRGKSDQGN